MISLAERFVVILLRLVQYTPFRGKCNSFVVGAPRSDEFSQAEIEAEHSRLIMRFIARANEGFSFNLVCVLSKK